MKSRNTEMPNLFVIGAAKSGTTSLHHYLGLHPEISMSSIKEPRYFLESFHPGSGRPHIKSRDEYLGLFESGAALRGEASVAYSAFPYFSGVPGRIAEESPDSHLIYAVRDPVERIVSGTRARVANGRLAPPESGDLASFWFELLGDLDPATNSILARSMYMFQLDQYLDFFAADSILVIDQQDLKNDRRSTLESVFDFLGVDRSFEHHQFEVERNSGSTVAFGALNYRLRTNQTLRRASTLLPEASRKKLTRAVARYTGRKIELPKIPSELEGGLRELFRPDLQRLREFTGQSFSTWSV